jgi:3-phosphoshikimate 1-carboxyvinyltransferase
MLYIHPIIIKKTKNPLTGSYEVPGDKSISHRSILVNALIPGTVRIANINTGTDVQCSLESAKNLGIECDINEKNEIKLNIPPVLEIKNQSFWAGNSGTTARFLCGVLSGNKINAQISGDESLCKRPMSRVMAPLHSMGVKFKAINNEFLPMSIEGSSTLKPIHYCMPVASAQVKSAIILAGIQCNDGVSIIEEPIKTRDHTELLLQSLQIPIEIEDHQKGGQLIKVPGFNVQRTLCKKDRFLMVPGDPSAAAFWVVAATIIQGSHILVPNVCLNDVRIGFIDVLKKMGSKITIANKKKSGGEIVGDLEISYASLEGVCIKANEVARTIDEYPILAIAAAMAKGKSVFEGLRELRFKESNRLFSIANGLKKCGIATEIEGDNLIIWGNNGQGITAKNAEIDAQLDHRIAMSFAILALASDVELSILGYETVSSSFPNFFEKILSI